MKKAILITLLALVYVLIGGCNERKDEAKIMEAVARLMENYPGSRLTDIYKSFFQDEFGPGHLLEDTQAARDYFLWELDEMKSSRRYIAEPCGCGENFVRVPMDLVKDSLISSEEYFKAFLESSARFHPPDIVQWSIKWQWILSVIHKMGLEIPGSAEDERAIAEMLGNGQATVHHSSAYKELYDPHYRIMTVEHWEALHEGLMKIIQP